MSKIGNALHENLLTLNTSKTRFLCFSKTAANNPHSIMSLRIHTCSNTSMQPYGSDCSCYLIERSHTIKYLGVMIDHNINFKEHIMYLSGKVRRLIYVMKCLRDCTPTKILRTVYISLCQSVIHFCISVWGSAGKSYFIIIERAQRALLKVALRKPLRFSTDELYREFKVYRVRQLFIINAVNIVHQKVKARADYTKIMAKRTYNIPLPHISSQMAERSPAYSLIKVYNNVCRLIMLKNCNNFQCNKMIRTLLYDLSYDTTENLI